MTHHFGVAIDEGIDGPGEDRVVSINGGTFDSDLIGLWSTHVERWADMAEKVPG